MVKEIAVISPLFCTPHCTRDKLNADFLLGAILVFTIKKCLARSHICNRGSDHFHRAVQEDGLS